MASSTTPFLLKNKHNSSVTIGDNDMGLESLEEKTATSNEDGKKSKARVCRTLICLLAIWGFVNLGFQLAAVWKPFNNTSTSPAHLVTPQNQDPSINECDCGNSIAEAESQGCIYDSLAAAWLPPECRDDDLTAEFDRAGPGPHGEWQYFADAEGKVPINKTQVAAMADNFDFWYSTKEWHVVHCNFYWQKRFRMRETGSIMERRNDHIAHVKHCGMVVLDSRPLDALIVKAQVVLNSAEE